MMLQPLEHVMLRVPARGPPEWTSTGCFFISKSRWWWLGEDVVSNPNIRSSQTIVLRKLMKQQQPSSQATKNQQARASSAMPVQLIGSWAAADQWLQISAAASSAIEANISRNIEAWQQTQIRVHQQKWVWSADAANKQGRRSLGADTGKVYQQLREQLQLYHIVRKKCNVL